MPWTTTEGSDQHDHAKQWQLVRAAADNSKAFTYLPYDGAQHDLIKNLKTWDVIYVLGHGSPSTDCIWPYPALQSGQLTHDKVCDRLIESGLSKWWTGDLKFYACHSAQGHDKAFASHCAAYLKQKEYKFLQCFGYVGSIESLPGTMIKYRADASIAGIFADHRYVKAPAYAPPVPNVQRPNDDRAREYRVPFPKLPKSQPHGKP